MFPFNGSCLQYILYGPAVSHCFCVSLLLLDVPMDTMASPPCQGDPASPVIAMATWTYPYLAAVIQSQASVCAAVKVMAAQLATVALKVTMGMPSQPKTANVSKPSKGRIKNRQENMETFQQY